LLIPEVWVKVWISIASNTTGKDGFSSIRAIFKIWDIPVVGANPAPAFLKLIQDLELDFVGIQIASQFLSVVVDGRAKVDAKIIVNDKIIQKIVEDPMTKGNKGSDMNNHPRFIATSNGPFQARNKHSK